jgi:S-methylmethionine-dependent homocysteine/selenocysteine methylase
MNDPLLIVAALNGTRQRDACPKVPLSPEELDGRDEIDATAPATFAAELIATGQEHGLSILGGCCGTDASHLRAVAALLRR